MLRCAEHDLPEVIALLAKDIPNCFYMYVDISKYGLSNQNMNVWLQRTNNRISAVVMKYFDSMQVYTLPECDMKDIAALIQQEFTPIVTGTAENCAILGSILKDTYEVSYGWTFEIDKFRTIPAPVPIVQASDEELAECAALICMDKEIGSHYTQDSLARQLKARRHEGMGRNYVIHQNGRVIAHIATYAEFENFAVSGGLIVHPDWRSAPYGAWLESYLFNTLLAEKKRVFSFLRNERRVKYYKALGATTYWGNGKLIRKGA